MALCAKGLGFCFCPDTLARATLSDVQYRALREFPLGEAATYPIRLAHRTDPPVRSTILSFIEMARQIPSTVSR